MPLMKSRISLNTIFARTSGGLGVRVEVKVEVNVRWEGVEGASHNVPEKYFDGVRMFPNLKNAIRR